MKKLFLFIFICLILLTLSSCKKTHNDDIFNESKTYIGNITLNEDQLQLDPFEYIIRDDEERIKELNLSDRDMPNGYYIYNESEDLLSFTITDETEFTFYDTGNIFVSEDQDKKYTTTDKESFKKFLYRDSDTPIKLPFWVTVQDEKVLSVTEEFVN